jgi:impB/mucB/samB family protein
MLTCLPPKCCPEPSLLQSTTFRETKLVRELSTCYIGSRIRRTEFLRTTMIVATKRPSINKPRNKIVPDDRSQNRLYRYGRILCLRRTAGHPELRGKPVIVAWRGNRSVVCAASYEARRFGVCSAMPAVRAERLCPEAIFVPPDFSRYRAASHLTREIFKRHTDLVEPLSLDEAYLDVTENKTGLPTLSVLQARFVNKSVRS